jgi:hypothetical protein
LPTPPPDPGPASHARSRFTDRSTGPIGTIISLSQGTSLTEERHTLPIEFHAKNLAVTNALHYIVEDRPGTVWIADVSVTTKKGQ